MLGIVAITFGIPSEKQVSIATEIERQGSLPHSPDLSLWNDGSKGACIYIQCMYKRSRSNAEILDNKFAQST